MTRTLAWLMGGASALVMLAVAMPSGASTPGPMLADPPAPTDGPTVYTDTCAKCHGADGKGDTKVGKKLKVKPMSDAEVQKAPDAEMVKAIKEGKGEPDEDGEKPMPSYPKLSDDDVKALVAHIRTLKK